MSLDAIFLSNGQIYQLIERIHPNKIQTFPKLGTKSPTKAITLFLVSISMITCVLAQVIEDLCILHHSTGALC